jgi:hypothetical protein
LFAAVTLPVVVNGAPLLDDFGRCVDPQKPGYWHEHFERQGAFRPATTIEIVVTNGLCNRIPFSFIMLIPWLLTLGVALLTRAFLNDIGVNSPWSEIGAGLWLLAPLGTESAMWPAALHVPLGLGLALMALRSYRRGCIPLGMVLALGSYLSVEQTIFALPLAAWLVSPRDRRLGALVSSASLSVAVLTAYAIWPGAQHRLAVSLVDRIEEIFKEPQSYAVMPATGLGAQSIPAGVEWAFPMSLAVLAIGAMAGWFAGPRLLLTQQSTSRLSLRSALPALALVVLINVPVALTFPHPDSPRIFAPTWLALVVFGAIAGSRLRWRRPRIAGTVGGLLLAGALLSLALSSSVRIRSANVVEEAMNAIASKVPDQATVAVCGVTRTIVEPAPTGDFSIHEFLNLPGEAYEYYTGKTAEFRLGGYSAPRRCPDVEEADLVVDFPDLVDAR